MLNMRREAYNTVFYSYLACFMNTVTLNMNIFLSTTGFTRRNMVVYQRVSASQEYVNTYSTRRVGVMGSNLMGLGVE